MAEHVSASARAWACFVSAIFFTASAVWMLTAGNYVLSGVCALAAGAFIYSVVESIHSLGLSFPDIDHHDGWQCPPSLVHEYKPPLSRVGEMSDKRFLGWAVVAVFFILLSAAGDGLSYCWQALPFRRRGKR